MTNHDNIKQKDAVIEALRDLNRNYQSTIQTQSNYITQLETRLQVPKAKILARGNVDKSVGETRVFHKENKVEKFDDTPCVGF